MTAKDDDGGGGGGDDCGGGDDNADGGDYHGGGGNDGGGDDDLKRWRGEHILLCLRTRRKSVLQTPPLASSSLPSS